jgi:hypothetical protein
MKIFDRSGSHFLEFERRGDKFELKGRGFVRRAKTNGSQPCQMQQATESPLIHDGSQMTLSTLQDARNSTLTGTTLAGPSGSGQFLALTFSTLDTARTVTIASTLAAAAGSSAATFYGILQNKPRGGEAADVGIFGISKAVAGTTTVTAGIQLAMSATSAGTLVPYTTGSNVRVGMALESVTGVGQVFTMALYGFGQGGGST